MKAMPVLAPMHMMRITHFAIAGSQGRLDKKSPTLRVQSGRIFDSPNQELYYGRMPRASNAARTALATAGL